MRTHCDVILRWPDGHESGMGRMDFEFTKDGMKGKPVKAITRRFGWAMIRQGMRMITKGAKDDDEVH